MTNQQPQTPTDHAPVATHTKPTFFQPPIVAAIISAASALACVFVTWLISSRVQADVQKQALAMEALKLDLAERQLNLDSVRVEIAAAAQRNSETVTSLEQARYELERQSSIAAKRQDEIAARNDGTRTKTDEIRLAAELTKLGNDLRPNIAVDCSAKAESTHRHEITCRFHNNGAHRAVMTLADVELMDRSSMKLVAGGVQEIDSKFSTAILSGGKGSKVFWVQLSEIAAGKRIILLELNAETDTVAVNMASRLAHGAITEGELKLLSKQGYVWRIWL